MAAGVALVSASSGEDAPIRQPVEVLVPEVGDVPGLIALINVLAAERASLFIQPIDPATGPALLEAHLAAIAASGTQIVLVAKSGATLVGLVTGTRGIHPARYGAIEVGIGVAPSHRGTGIGQALLTAFEAAAGQRGFHRISLNV